MDLYLLDVLATIKRIKLGQYGMRKGQAKEPGSMDSTTSRKSLESALETPMQYMFNAKQAKHSVVDAQTIRPVTEPYVGQPIRAEFGCVPSRKQFLSFRGAPDTFIKQAFAGQTAELGSIGE
jgi:hypothetical protein